MERDKLVSLVTRTQNGDGGAMSELFDAYYKDVFRFARTTLKNEDLACDITQETFLEIIRTIGNLKEPAAFVTWMKMITYHQCTRYFRKKKEVLVDEDEDGNTIFDTLADESEGSIPSEVYEQEEFRNTIMGIVNELSEEQRSAVMMYYYDEMTVGQIAQVQGVSDGTVKSRLNYARKSLKKSVEEYEKKHGIKLHSFSILPLLLLFFGREKMSVAKAAEIRNVVSEAAGAWEMGLAAAEEVVASGVGAGEGGAASVTGTGSVTGAGGTAGAATVVSSGATTGASAAAAGAGIGAKAVGMSMATKIIAGVAALAVAVGGGAVWMNKTDRKPVAVIPHVCEDMDRDCACDTCGNTIHHGAPDPYMDHDAFCIDCGFSFGVPDQDNNDICDFCGEYPCGPYHQKPHAYENEICVWCGDGSALHVDENEDGFCEHCGEAMCLLEETEHRFLDGYCLCEICGEGSHVEGDVHPFCGVCKERLPIDDRDGDGACDTCGEYRCGGSNHGAAHLDENEDELCDVCQKYMCGLVWGLEHTFNYDDGIYDGKCDKCGQTSGGMGWFEDEDANHGDANGDGICDCCSQNMCNIYGLPEFGGVDADGDEKCDICNFIMCDGHGNFVYHYDFDHDSKCDRCGHYICAHGYLPHTDANGDGKCDNCHGVVQ